MADDPHGPWETIAQAEAGSEFVATGVHAQQAGITVTGNVVTVTDYVDISALSAPRFARVKVVYAP